MGRSRHTEAQIIGALKQVEAGRAMENVAGECAVSHAKTNAWKAKFGSLDASGRVSA